MTKETSIKLFESKKIRVHWNNDDEKWYFPVIDIIETLTGSNNPRRYWSDLKRKLSKKRFYSVVRNYRTTEIEIL